MSLMMERLQQLLDPEAVQAEAKLPTEAQVDAATRKAEAVLAKMAPADLSDEVVQRFAGKTSVQSIGLLLDTAQALRAHPEVAAATGVSADDAEGAARLMIAAGGTQTGFAALHEGIDAAALLCTRDIDATIDATLSLAEALPQRDAEKAFVARCLFGEPARLRKALVQAADPRPAPELIGALAPQLERRQRVNDLLDDIKNDRLALRDVAAGLLRGKRKSG